MKVLMFLQWCCWGIHSGHHIPGKPNAWFKYHYMVYEFFQITQCKQALYTNIICITGALCHCFYLKIWVGLIGRRFEGMAWLFRISCPKTLLLSRMLQSRPVPCFVADFTHFLCFTPLPVMRLFLASLSLRMEDVCFSET